MQGRGHGAWGIGHGEEEDFLAREAWGLTRAGRARSLMGDELLGHFSHESNPDNHGDNGYKLGEEQTCGPANNFLISG